jgi:hypothetical protein
MQRLKLTYTTKNPCLFVVGMQLQLLQSNVCNGLTGLVPLPATVTVSGDQTLPPGGVNGGTSSGIITIPGPTGSADPATLAKFMAWGTKCSDAASTACAPACIGAVAVPPSRWFVCCRG